MTMNRFLDFSDPFYRPLWIRVTIVAICVAWAAFEFVSGAVFWAMLFGALGLYTAYALLLAYAPPGETAGGGGGDTGAKTDKTKR